MLVKFYTVVIKNKELTLYKGTSDKVLFGFMVEDGFMEIKELKGG